MLPERVAFAGIALRPFEAGDAPEVERLLADPHVAEPTSVIPLPYEPGMAATWIAGRRVACDRGEYAYAITARDSQCVVGAIALRTAARAQEHFGYWIGREYWGRGHATDAVAALLALGFGFLDEPLLSASHLARNRASARVLEKNGLVEVRREYRAHRSSEELVVVRAITREAWELQTGS